MSDCWQQGAGRPLTPQRCCFPARLLLLGAYAWPIVAIGLGSSWQLACGIVAWGTGALFDVDYAVRIRLAVERWGFAKANPLDLPAVAFRLLRPLRLLRLPRAMSQLNRHSSSSLRGRVATYVAGSTVLLVLCASLAILDSERVDADANIVGLGDALWWTVTTISTVGYGDRFPGERHRPARRAGAHARRNRASLDAWLVQRVAAEEELSQPATSQQLDELRGELLHTMRARLTLHRRDR